MCTWRVQELKHMDPMWLIPWCGPKLSQEPDPLCAACLFGKSNRLLHESHSGHISSGHTQLGQGVSSDGLESSTQGRPFTMKGSPSKLWYNFCSFWVDHMSRFVYVTFHSSKAASELDPQNWNLKLLQNASTLKYATYALTMVLTVLSSSRTPA
jgi:hypothetical protein